MAENLDSTGHELNTSDSITNDELSLITTLINRFVSEACNVPKRLYCPFCLFDFAFDFLLNNHIQQMHMNEIKNFSRINLEIFTFDLCLYCHAKFYIRNLLPKHVIRKHQECIMNFTFKVKQTGYIQCKFCSYKVLQQQYKLLFIHLENKHLQHFAEILSNLNLEFDKLKIPYDSEEEKLLALDTCMNKLSLQNMSSNDKRDTKIKSILKCSESVNDHGVRRKLRFDLPNVSFSSVDSENKENIGNEFKKRKQMFDFPINFARNNILRRSKSIMKTSNKVNPEAKTCLSPTDNISTSPPILLTNAIRLEDGVDMLHVMPYRCGLCIEGFHCNSLLVHHMKRIHPGFKFKPRYRCGECKAKFYKNSYLLRHYYSQHNRVSYSNGY